MAVLYDSPICLAVLNPKGRDPFLDYHDGPESYEKGVHAPVNFHAYAAATYGAFYDSASDLLQQKDRFDAVLVLIRRRTWITLAAVKELKAAGMRVIVSWKECSHNQVSRQLRNAKTIRAYGGNSRLGRWHSLTHAGMAAPMRTGWTERVLAKTEIHSHSLSDRIHGLGLFHSDGVASRNPDWDAGV